MVRGARLLVLCAVALLVPATADAARSSLYRGPGPAPGPKLLYAKPRPPAPQLRNAGPWRARPILISGASAYRKGEFLYQDYLYDDSGARGLRDLSSPRTSEDDLFSALNGTYTYPSDPAYAQNAADLVELRVKRLRRATAFRITLNTLKDADLVATTIAIGDSGSQVEWPGGAGVTSPAELFLVVHGSKAEALRANGQPLAGPKPRVRVNLRRNQFHVRVPRRTWNPRRKRVPMRAGVGLWDEAADAYKTPGISLTASQPGGGGGLADPPAIFNLAFRFDEPWPDTQDLLGSLTDTSWWRDHDQAHALAGGNVSEFSATVDFGKLRRGATDPLRGEPGGIPRTGPMNRILSSRFSDGEGVDYNVACGETTGCTGQYLGRLQPYSIYVPEKHPRRYGLTLLLHSLGAMYNQFADSKNQSQFGERGKGHIVVTTESRGPDGWYYDRAGAEVFEVWADVARRYPLDPRRAAITGYSMGGYATYKLATQFPDLFAAGQPTVGPAGLGIGSGAAGSTTTPMLPSLRHVPLEMWVGTLDELVPIATTIAHAQAADDVGLRYSFKNHVVADHFALAVNDEYGPAAGFLGERRVVRNPAHVTYVRNPAMDFPKLGFRADHAYWLSGISTRGGGLGRVDAVSHAFGRGDPPVGATQIGAGALTGGTFGAIPFTEQSQGWGAAPSAPKRDRLELTLGNLDRIRVHVTRARLSCHPKLDVTSDGPAKVVLAGCKRKISVGG